MKQFYYIFLLLIPNLLNAQDCTDIIVSEIVFGEIDQSLTQTVVNHSIELFNPTDNNINLNKYKILLIDEFDNTTEINLSGIILSKSTFVISNSAANIGITDLSNALYADLDLNNKISFQIFNQSQVIEEIGKPTLSDVVDIDLSQFWNDPDYRNFIMTMNLNIKSIENLTVRRSGMIMKGGNLSTIEKLFKEWQVLPSYDISNLGLHSCGCVVPTLGWEDIGLFDPDAVRDEDDSEKVIGTVSIAGALTENIKIQVFEVAFEYGFYDNFATPEFDYSRLFTPNSDITIPAQSNSIDIEILQVFLDDIAESPEGIGFQVFVSDDNYTGAYTEEILDVFDVRIIDKTPTSISSYELIKNIKLYPAIAESEIKLESLNHSLIDRVAIRTIQGELIKIVNVNENFTAIDISNLMPGMHICIIETQEGYVTKKFYKF